MINSTANDYLVDDAAQKSFIPPSPAALHSILNNIEEGILLLDTNFTVNFINVKCRILLKNLYGIDCRPGLSIFKIMPDFRKANIKEHLEKALRGEPSRYELEILKAEKSSFWLTCTFQVFNLHTKNICVFVKDITTIKKLETAKIAQKEVEAHLNRTKILFESFMENTPVRAWITDENGKVHYLNSKFCQAHNLTKEAQGRYLTEIFPAELAERYHKSDLHILKIGKAEERIESGINNCGTPGSFKVFQFPLYTTETNMVGGWAVEITEQVDLHKKLMQLEKKKKKDIIRSIIETQENERRNLAVELHDNVNQILSSCKLMLEVALENKEKASLLTEKCYQSLQMVISEIRKISHDLNPSALNDIGLLDAINEMAEKINLSGKLHLSLKHTLYKNAEEICAEDKITVYRILQEQLNNILKHAQAKNICINLHSSKTKFLLKIEDDGIGFDTQKTKKGLGLRSIFHRVEYYNGKVKIDSEAGKGCKLKVLLNLSSGNIGSKVNKD